jgi:hypothetical protein
MTEKEIEECCRRDDPSNERKGLGYLIGGAGCLCYVIPISTLPINVPRITFGALKMITALTSWRALLPVANVIPRPVSIPPGAERG